MLWITLAFSQIATGVLGEQGKPPELMSADAYRAQIETARIEWSLFGVTGSPDDCDWYYTSKIAQSDNLEISRGLADGRAHTQAQEGEPYLFSEHRLLLKDGEQWSYYEDGPVAGVAVDRSKYLVYRNMRDLGFEPLPSASNVDNWVRSAPESYEEAEWASDRATIVAHWSNGLDIRWTLDPAYGMQPVEVVVLRDGEEGSSCVSTYREFDGIWYPQSCTFSHKGNETVRVTVLDAEFNRPEHPKELTPNDLGLIPGIQITHPAFGHSAAWTGSGLMPLKEWLDLAREGKVDYSAWEVLSEQFNTPNGLGHLPKRVDSEFLGLTVAVTRTPGLWEDYTRRFIQFCRLDVDQTRNAWQTLKQCQKPAYERLPGIQKEAKETEQQLAKLRGGVVAATDSNAASEPKHSIPPPGSASGSPSSGGTDLRDLTKPPATADVQAPAQPADLQVTTARIKELEEKLDTLYKPIATIFEKELKPGLNKLLTPEQKELVAKHDAEVKARSEPKP